MEHYTAEELVAFEDRIKGIFEAGELPFLLHLAGGNEHELVEIFKDVRDGDWILGSHRSHFHYLLAGGTEADLEQKIRDGRSMFLFNRKLNFLSSSVLAGTCGIAAGIALALKQQGSVARVWCFVGDGAEDNGHFAEAVRYATGQDLPVTFVVEDNATQVDTTYYERWGTNQRMDWGPKVRRYYYTRTFPHAGRGAGPQITFKPEVVARFSSGSGHSSASPVTAQRRGHISRQVGQ